MKKSISYIKALLYFEIILQLLLLMNIGLSSIDSYLILILTAQLLPVVFVLYFINKGNDIRHYFNLVFGFNIIGLILIFYINYKFNQQLFNIKIDINNFTLILFLIIRSTNLILSRKRDSSIYFNTHLNEGKISKNKFISVFYISCLLLNGYLIQSKNKQVFIESFNREKLDKNISISNENNQLIEIKKQLEILNKSCPKKIDDNLTLDSMTINYVDNSLSYYLQMNNVNPKLIDKNKFTQIYKRNFLESSKKDSTLLFFRENKTLLILNFRDKNGKEYCSININNY